jgi:hypothetical protein
MEGMDNKDNGAVFTRLVKAGKRTYFFDVKATRNGDFYLTVTESKKRFSDDGRFTFEKHKIFVYREDFDKFTDALRDTLDYIHSQPASENNYQNYHPNKIEPNGNIDENTGQQGFSDVSFEDLDK